ncbi:MAG: hypothetical protein IJ598_08740, partial [Ruminococcus sp.]|nr:hypothetical protein [Ruminococcus sp.]
MTITASFSNGATAVTTAPLFQWDIGQKLKITGVSVSGNVQVHFANGDMQQAIVKSAEAVSGGYAVDIPNEFLQHGGATPGRAWFYVKTSDTDGYTARTIYIPIIFRKRPNDYVSPEDPDSRGIVDQAIELLENYQSDLDRKLDSSDGAVKTEHIADSAVTLQKLAAEVKNIINGKADSATAYTFDATTAEASYRADNYKIIYLNATLINLNKKAIVITLKDANARQFGFCEDGSVYTRKLTSPGGSYVPESWVNVNAGILSSINALQNNKVDTETFTEFQELVAEEADNILQDITGLENASIATNNAVADVKAYIGYTDSDILGVCADFENNRFTRLAGAVGLSAGTDFDAFPMYGGRKRVVVTADG